LKKYNSFEYPMLVLNDLYIEGLLLIEQLEYEINVVSTDFMKEHIRSDIEIVNYNLNTISSQIKMLTLLPHQLN